MLNPRLFGLLERAFGVGLVKVVHEDVPLQGQYVVDATSRQRKRRLRVDSYGSGEEYRVSCPFCNDTRQRLYINHRWGIFDTESQTRNLWLAQCWNEQCLSDYENQRKLYDDVIGTNVPPGGLQLEPTDRPRRRRQYSLAAPGPVWPLTDMLRRSPRHAALEYLRSRLLNPQYLGQIFQVGYLPDADLPFARNRLYVPVIFQGRQAGWTVRYVGEPPKHIPKWFHCPGMDKVHLFYNFDRAHRHPTKVLVEGPPAVWGFGRQAMALLGKKIAAEQIQLLEQCCGAEDVIVLLLDPDQAPNDKEHHMEASYQALVSRRRFVGRVVKVYLPSGHDPGDTDRDYMRRLIHHCAARVGLTVSFRPPAEAAA